MSSIKPTETDKEIVERYRKEIRTLVQDRKHFQCNEAEVDIRATDILTRFLAEVRGVDVEKVWADLVQSHRSTQCPNCGSRCLSASTSPDPNVFAVCDNCCADIRVGTTTEKIEITKADLAAALVSVKEGKKSNEGV